MAGEEQWRRFERGTSGRDGGTKFWAIRVDRSRCLIRHGLVGAGEEAQLKVIEHDDASQARAQHKKRIRTKLRAGWVEVETEREAAAAPLGGRTFEEQLCASLVANPGDVEGWMVYADFLAQRAPILAERLALGLELAQASDRRLRRRLEGRITALERSEARALLGPTLAGILGERRFEDAITLERRHGMIVAAQLRDRATFSWRFEAIVASLLELDAAALLTELGIYSSARPEAFQAALAELLAKPRPSLQALRLDLGEVVAHADWLRRRSREPLQLPCTLEIAARLGLEQLTLVGPFASGRGESEQLRSLALRRVGVVRGVDVGGWKLPALEQLELADPHGVGGWREAELPSLRELVIKVPGGYTEVVAGLVDAPVLDGLELLALEASSLSEAGVELTLEHGARFDRIGRLILINPPRRPNRFAALERRFPGIELQRLGPRIRGRSANLLAEYNLLSGIGRAS